MTVCRIQHQNGCYNFYTLLYLFAVLCVIPLVDFLAVFIFGFLKT